MLPAFYDQYHTGAFVGLQCVVQALAYTLMPLLTPIKLNSVLICQAVNTGAVWQYVLSHTTTGAPFCLVVFFFFLSCFFRVSRLAETRAQ